MTREERNAAKVSGLHPEFRPLVETWLAKADAQPATAILIVQGRRTFAEQDALYAQGRTAPGKIVTNARAGKGYHNYGLAFDFVNVHGGTIKDAYDESDWNATDYHTLAALGIALGMEWGGLWRSIKDMPHLEWHPGFGADDGVRLRTWAADGFLPVAFFATRDPLAARRA